MTTNVSVDNLTQLLKTTKVVGASEDAPAAAEAPAVVPASTRARESTDVRASVSERGETSASTSASRSQPPIPEPGTRVSASRAHTLLQPVSSSQQSPPPHLAPVPATTPLTIPGQLSNDQMQKKMAGNRKEMMVHTILHLRSVEPSLKAHPKLGQLSDLALSFAIMNDMLGEGFNADIDTEQFGKAVEDAMITMVENESMTQVARDELLRVVKRAPPFGVMRTYLAFATLSLPVEFWYRPPGAVRERGVDEVQGRLPPDVFLERYVKRNRPCVMRGAFTAREFPPLERWTDEYLLERCGDRPISVRAKSKRDRFGNNAFFDFRETITLAEYLRVSKKARAEGSPVPVYAGKMILQQQLPELAAELEEAPTGIDREYKDVLGPLVGDGVYTYFGGGKNVTQTHYDPNNNLMLVIDGEKKVHLFPPSDVELVYPHNSPQYTYSALDAFTPPEGPPPLFDKYRGVHDRWTTLRKGDVFFLPLCWYHTFAGGAGRNQVLNYWFTGKPTPDTEGPRLEGSRPSAARVLSSGA
mmetsp:Transcript_16584/g.54151  ORF Transcript_16584/g.54151 Transcript_16584/m.54151 type:complete len:528 (+) Transcript_16584:293-1876(+)